MQVNIQQMCNLSPRREGTRAPNNWLTTYVCNVTELLVLSISGDHPPITPVGLALPHELVSSDNQRIYELVCRHFLATISADAIFQCTRARFSTASSADAGGAGRAAETFTARGKKETQPGFLLVYRTCVGLQQQSSVDDEAAELEGSGGSGGGDTEEGYSGGLVELPELEKGKGYRVASVKARTGATRAPGMKIRHLRFYWHCSHDFSGCADAAY
jgi:DNA topoisomerase IA